MVDLTIGAVTGNPAYGGIEHFQNVALSDINSTPQVIPATSGAVPFPKGVIQDIDNNALVFEEEGIWNVTLTVTLIFLGVNNPRSFGVEFYNATKDEVLVTPLVPVGRNTEGSTPAASLLLAVQPPAAGNLFQMRLVSTTDTFADVFLNFFSFNVIRIDEAHVEF